MRTLSYVRAATFGSGRNAWPEQVQTSCGGPACGRVQKIVALGHENSPAPRARQDDEKRDPVRRDGHAVRIFCMPCGFFTVFADFQRVVRIFCMPCGLSAARNRPVTVFLGLKAADSGSVRRRISMTNPHRSLKIRTISQESARPAENPHSPLKIRTAVVLRRGPRVVPLRIA